MRARVLMLVLSGFWAVAALAQDVASVSIEVTPSTVQAGEPVMLKVRIVGSDVDKLSFPEVDGLVFHEAPSTSVAQMRRTPSGISQIREFGFVVDTTKPGKFEIPSVTATLNGKDIASNSATVTVTESTVPPRPRPMPRRAPGSAMAPRLSDSTAIQDEGIDLNDVISISTDVDKREVYQGAPITLTLTFMRMVSPYNVEPSNFTTSLPTLTGFYALPREPEEVGSPEVRTINGWQYEVQTYKQKLFPTTSGDLEIGAWQWQGVLLARGIRPQPVELSADAIPIHVKPLPDRPVAFSGSVGTFKVEANLDKARVIQGVPAKLNVRISGEGNPDAIGEPKLPAMDWAYVGDVEKDLGQQSAGMGAGVDQRFVFPVTPIEAGTKVIPEIEYCYFNPETGTYETTKTEPLELSVVPSAEPVHQGVTGAGAEGSSLKGPADGIDTIVAYPGVLRRQGGSALSMSFAVATPPVAYAFLAIFLRRRRRLATDSRFARSYRARTRLKSALETVRTSSEPAAALFKAVIGFIADKFDVPEAGMTSLDAQHILERNEIASEVTAALVKVLRSCERAQYASTTLTHDELSALLEGASVNLDTLDAELKRRAEK